LGLAGLQHSARRSKPKGTLFFVGPTGVGKTELAKAIAEFLFGDEAACIRLDMSEYSHEHSDQRLIGAPPGYVGFEEGGQLTNAVRERPFCVLLFDEIEKAHPRILDKFLQILEDGRLTDGRGETAHFSETVIIFTSNIGAADMPAATDRQVVRDHFIRAVERHFVGELGRPELLNRLGENVVVFEPITNPGLRRSILQRKIVPLHSHLQERFGVNLRLDEGLEGRFVESARMDHGGRGLNNAVENLLLNPLSRFLFGRRHQLRRGRTVAVHQNGTGVEFELLE
jgi:ATP-dependent Clp protease ATP-binding subunit ClpA